MIFGLSFLSDNIPRCVTKKNMMGLAFPFFFNILVVHHHLHINSVTASEVADFFTVLKTVYHKLECLCGHLMSDCVFSEILVYL